MYRNLEAEMIRKQISKYDIAELIKKTYNTVTEKLKGKYPFTLDEAIAIQEKYFPKLTIEYLFKKNEDE
ncbi:MAG TPA: DNA-binding protein [Clostridiales bacterium]|nr:DNA-binding protein [Clostridiales bacterium]